MTGSVGVSTNAVPTAYAVTGGGSLCPGGAGVAVGLANSQTGVNYQLQLGGSATGGSISGSTGAVIDFGNKTVAGTYTVVATQTSGGCTANMTGNAVINASTCPIPAGSVTSAITSTTVTYSWSAASCASSYRTCMRKASNLVWTYADVTTLTRNFTALSPATEYRFRVRSKCSATILGSLSSESRATTLGAALVQNADNSTAELQQTRSDVTETRVSVFPNPSADVFNLDVQTAAKGDVAASITDLSGRVVAQWQANLTDGHTARQINLGQLPTGIYYLRLTFPDGSVEMRSLIKN